MSRSSTPQLLVEKFDVTRTRASLVNAAVNALGLVVLSVYLLNTKGVHSEASLGWVAEDSDCLVNRDGKVACVTKFIYNVDGKYHKGIDITSRPFVKKSRVKVLYNPNDITDSVLYTGGRVSGAYFAGFGAALLLATSASNHYLAVQTDVVR